MDRSSMRYEVVEKKDLTAVRQLIRREYEKQGFLKDEEAFEKLSAFLNLPAATTFAAREKDGVVGTVSVIGYSAAGIPMESIFADEVQGLRDGNIIAEVGQLAVDRDAVGRKDGMKVMMALFSLVLTHAQQESIDRMCIVVNPRHDFFYNRLGFETFGRKDFYGAVSAPAVAKYLDVQGAVKNPLIQFMRR